MGTRRDHHDPGSHGGRPCNGRGQRPEWGGTACRVRCRPGRGRSTRRGARARCSRVCDQGRTCRRAGRIGRERRATRVPVAARPAPGGDPRARTRRPAVAERHLLVGVPLLGARRGDRTAQQAHQCMREHSQWRGERRREVDRDRFMRNPLNLTLNVQTVVMRPLRYSINVTLDGCCYHRPIPADEDFHRHAAEILDQADALLFCRVTYEMMEAAWRPSAPTGARPDWMEPFARTIDAAKKYVVSSTLEQVDWNAELVRGDLGRSEERRVGKECRSRWSPYH